VVEARVGEAEVNGAGERLPHFAAEAVGEADLDEARALRVAQEGEVAAVGCVCCLLFRTTTKKNGWETDLEDIASTT
jgi:hypothetical protein